MGTSHANSFAPEVHVISTRHPRQGPHLKRNGSNGVGIDGAPRIWFAGSIPQNGGGAKHILSAEINEKHTSGPKGRRSLVSLCTG
jgi:hypothetical protein